MAKRFMYVCLGILALAVAFHLGAQYGRADTIVDHATEGIVALDQTYVLLANGEVWEICGIPRDWYRKADKDPPIPVSEIKFWAPTSLVTISNEMWYRTDAAGWVNFGSPPGGVLTQSATWGAIKAQFSE